MNGLVTDGNTNLCCRGFILAPFQSTTANKNDYEHTRDYKRALPVWEPEILRVTVKKWSFLIFYVDYWRFSDKRAENNFKEYLGFLLMFIKTDKLSNKYNNIVFKMVYWIIAFLRKIQRFAEK